MLVVYPIVLRCCSARRACSTATGRTAASISCAARRAQRVLVLGAGRAGEALVRDLRARKPLSPGRFSRRQPSLRGAQVHGVPVLGTLEHLPQLARETAAEMLLIAMPSATNAQMQRVGRICAKDATCRSAPCRACEDVVAGRSSFNELKEVAIEDLLGRDPVQLDWTAIRTRLAGQRVLVTGGGGSIGSELCRQVARLGAESLTVLELSEYNLYRDRAGTARRISRPDPQRRARRLRRRGDAASACSRRARPQSFSMPPRTSTCRCCKARCARRSATTCSARRSSPKRPTGIGVDSFVLISTDKAVNPTSVMGACKRVAGDCSARISRSQSRTRFITVRFGNVLDSAGSVVPLFPRTDPQGRTGDGDASGNHALLHDDSRSLPADPAGGRARQGRRDLRARHGRAGAHPRISPNR